MNKIKILISLFLISFSILPVFAINWVECANKIYIDIDNIEPSYDELGNKINGEYSYWLKILNDKSEPFKNSEQLLNKKIWYSLQHTNISCNTKTTSLEEFIYYDLNNNPIYSETNFLKERNAIVPGSVADFIYQNVCIKR